MFEIESKNQDVITITTKKISVGFNVNEGTIDGKAFHEHTHETNEVRFFPLEKLPEISKKLTKGEIDRLIKAYRLKEVIFD